MPVLRLPGAAYTVPVPLDSTDVPSRLNSGDENSSRASISRSACRLLCEHLREPRAGQRQVEEGRAPKHTPLKSGPDLTSDSSARVRTGHNNR